jgi:hypothetical protein
MLTVGPFRANDKPLVITADDIPTTANCKTGEKNMGSEFFLATLFNLGMNLIYTLVALFIGIFALQIIDKKLLKSIDIEQEIKNNNMAVAVFSSTILLFVALIVSFGLKG